MCFHWCTHLRYGHKLTGSYLIPCAFSDTTEPASVSHDRRETVNIRTWPTISHAQRASGSPGTLPLGRPLAQCSCANGTDHADSLGRRHALVDGVRQGHSSNLSSRQQPVNQLSTGQQSRPNGSPGHANIIIWSWSLQARLPLIQKGWQWPDDLFISLLPRWTASQVQEMSTSITCSKTTLLLSIQDRGISQ